MAANSDDSNTYRDSVHRNIAKIIEMISRISYDDFSKHIDFSDDCNDEFRKVYSGLNLLIDKLAETRHELEEERAFGRLRAEIWNHALVWTGNMEVLVGKLLEIIGPIIRTTGVCYFQIESISRNAVCKREWIPEGEVSVLGLKIPYSLWAAYAGEGWIELNINDLERTGGKEMAQLLRESGTGSLLGMSCNLHDIPYGIIVFADRNENRRWKERERNLLFELANIISAKAVQAESAEALRIQKLESLGTLAGGLAHDFNNILTGIIGNISIAKRANTDRAAALEALESAEAAAFHARRLANQFLTFSTGGLPVKKTALLGEIIEHCAGFCLRGSNVSCKLRIAPDLAPVDVDIGQMEQVFINLLINAKQAMPGGGEVGISAENIVVEGAGAAPVAPGKYVRVTVSDTGTGIPRRNLQKIFDPYFTTKNQGNGLGLTIAHSIISKHGGHIQADSDGVKGASFTFYLPSSDKMPLQDTVKKKVDKRKGARVLIMDDDRIIRVVISKILKAEGMEVLEAFNGAEAVSSYSKALNEGRRFDVILMDLTIAGGECGKETVSRILSVDTDARAIVISGYSNDPVMSDYGKYGFCAMIPKPFEVKQLLETIDVALEKKE